MKPNKSVFFALLLFLITLPACRIGDPGTERMREMLAFYRSESQEPGNFFANRLRVAYFDSLRMAEPENIDYWYKTGREAIRAGDNDKAIAVFQEMQRILEAEGHQPGDMAMQMLKSALALAWLRKGEIDNCLQNHSAASCILPLQPAGFHQLTTGSEQAAALYEDLLALDPSQLEYRWLYTIALMTLGKYPESANPDWAIRSPALETGASEVEGFPRFQDVGAALGVAVRDLSGGVVIEDFNNDGWLDIMASSWGLEDQVRLFIAKPMPDHIMFEDQTQAARLLGITGGLNMVQADYNNDGFTDVLVLRGAWLMDHGKHPNSLLRNNGDGTFSDVTEQSGLLSFKPTQTAVWRDFNNDGWVDVFIGNEARNTTSSNSCELFINQGNGTFKNTAPSSGLMVNRFVKGVTAADFDGDGWQDVYVSTLYGKNYLFRNQGNGGGTPKFVDVTEQAGLPDAMDTFPCWFWDYDNDGHQDIFVNEFLFEVSKKSGIIEQVAAGYLGMPNQGATPRLFRNQGDGTFVEMTDSLGLNKVAYTMGSNFGDLNNDGWPDAYLGTGEPGLSGAMPNRAFLNQQGKGFVEVTAPAGLGHIQKGHAIAFGDLDRDGDQDIYAVLGGAFEGDLYFNALFENPFLEAGKPAEMAHQWLSIQLEGRESNRKGIGAKVRIYLQGPNGSKRVISKELNPGGSFGSNPLRIETGLGNAEKVEAVEVFWPVTGKTQRFEEVAPNQFLKITEGEMVPEVLPSGGLPFPKSTHHHHHM